MSSNAITQHIPVLVDEVVEMIQAREPGVYLDCTVGGAGHTCALLDAHAENRVIGADRDGEALERARVRLSSYGNRAELHHARFSELHKFVPQHSIRGAVADLGVSTDQLLGKRGFSFHQKGPLDMRMDTSVGVDARDLVNEIGEGELFRLLKEGGVGREARAVAAAIVRARPIETSEQLASVIAKAAYGKSSKRTVHPATVPFQALRMAVNNELEEMTALLDEIPSMMESGGRLAVITFHSIEETVVTRRMRFWQSADDAPAWWPQQSGKAKSLGKLLTPKGIRASQKEIARNASARSASLRVFEFV